MPGYDMSPAPASWPRLNRNKGFEMFSELVRSVLSEMSLQDGVQHPLLPGMRAASGKLYLPARTSALPDRPELLALRSEGWKSFVPG